MGSVSGACFSVMGRKANNKCTCQGCLGQPEKRTSSHDDACLMEARFEPKYGSYCRRCYKNYLCVRCDCCQIKKFPIYVGLISHASICFYVPLSRF